MIRCHFIVIREITVEPENSETRLLRTKLQRAKYFVLKFNYLKVFKFDAAFEPTLTQAQPGLHTKSISVDNYVEDEEKKEAKSKASKLSAGARIFGVPQGPKILLY